MWGASGSALGDGSGPHTPAAQTAHALGRQTRTAWRVLTPLHPPRRQASQAVALLPTSHTQMRRPGSAPAPDITSSGPPRQFVSISSLGAHAQGSQLLAPTHLPRSWVDADTTSPLESLSPGGQVPGPITLEQGGVCSGCLIITCWTRGV